MGPQARPLIEVLAERPALRSPRGKRPPRGALLALACSALRCGSRRETAIAEGGRPSGAPLVHAVGCPQRAPCAATRPTVWRRGERAA